MHLTMKLTTRIIATITINLISKIVKFSILTTMVQCGKVIDSIKMHCSGHLFCCYTKLALRIAAATTVMAVIIIKKYYN